MAAVIRGSGRGLPRSSFQVPKRIGVRPQKRCPRLWITYRAHSQAFDEVRRLLEELTNDRVGIARIKSGKVSPVEGARPTWSGLTMNRQ